MGVKAFFPELMTGFRGTGIKNDSVHFFVHDKADSRDLLSLKVLNRIALEVGTLRHCL